MIHFLVHDSEDSVGVIVTEDVKANQTLTGWVMNGDASLDIQVLDDVPIGHKLALQDIASGDTVLKYGHDIGRAIADIPKGGHVHVHNLKTKRW